MIDLRSDTVTHPTPAMRKAMYEAELGDDVFGDDPTVNALQERAAELLGKEAALFVASGSMANLVSQLAHLGRGQETIAGAGTHMVDDEQAGHAVVVGTSIKQMRENPDGTFDLDELEGVLPRPGRPARADNRPRRDREHARSFDGTAAEPRLHPRRRRDRPRPRRAAPCRWGALLQRRDRPRADAPAAGRAGRFGGVLPFEGAGLPCRLDGRRLEGVRPPGLARPEARRRRNAPGRCARRRGAGGPAATARTERSIGSPRTTPTPACWPRGWPRWTASNRPAAWLSRHPDRWTRLERPPTSSIFRVRRDRAAFLDALRSRGVLMVEYAHGTIRAVTHYGVTAADIERVLAACRDALRETTTDTAASTSPAHAAAAQALER